MLITYQAVISPINNNSNLGTDRVFILCTSMENRTIARHLHCMVTRFMNREIPTFTKKIESIEEMNTTGREEEKRHA